MPRKERLDKETVVKAAVDLVNAEGLDALNLHRLADRLGVQTPSLYNHVDGLAGLNRDLALYSVRNLGECMGNATIGEVRPAGAAGAGSGIPRLHQGASGIVYGESARESCHHSRGRRIAGCRRARGAGWRWRWWQSFGIYGNDALHAVRGFRSVVHGFATLEVAGGFGLPLDCDESFRRLVRMLIHGLQHRADAASL